jgi:hypothetical protein
MPDSVRDTIASFIAEHHVEPTFVKRRRNRADPDAWYRAARNTGATMSNDPDFLARWSRRKRVAATDKIKQSQQIETSDGAAAETTPASLAPDENILPFDPAGLSTIAPIGVEFNVRAFLETGAPDDLVRAALRRAWSVNPAIRDFVGLSENSWDSTPLARWLALHQSTGRKSGDF